MLKWMGLMIKATVFALAVIVGSHWIKWDGISLSDSIRTGMAHAEKSSWMKQVRKFSNQMTDKIWGSTDSLIETESIRPSERAKLRKLIQDINSTR